LRLALKVWQRDADVYLVTWKTNVVPPLMEPILYLAAFGAGLGTLIASVTWRGEPVGYAAFIAPGMIAVGVMFQAFFENTYATFVRMRYQKTFDALLSTPLGSDEIVLGELLWGASKGTLAGLVMMLVISCFGLLEYPSALGIIPYSFLNGLMFSGLALCFTAKLDSIDAFNFPTFLLITPMYLFSGTFFPLEVLPPWARTLAWALPLTHASAATRELGLGTMSGSLAISVGYTILFAAACWWIGFRWMRRRLIK